MYVYICIYALMYCMLNITISIIQIPYYCSSNQTAASGPVQTSLSRESFKSCVMETVSETLLGSFAFLATKYYNMRKHPMPSTESTYTN